MEEAVHDFSDRDGLYGSRHLAQKLAANADVSRVRGLFLLDVIGYRDLKVARETGSSRSLQNDIAQAANRLGYAPYFFRYDANITDDHESFIMVGVPAVDVVDAQYGRTGMGEFAHTSADTMDKVSQRSFEIAGRTILLTVERLDDQK